MTTDGEDFWYPRAASGLRWRQTDGAFLVTVSNRPGVHALNQTGVLLLELANGRHTVDEMAELLQAAFALPEPPVEAVSRFLDSASRAGLVIAR